MPAPFLFELHLTVAPLPLAQEAAFEATCTALAGRALLIELARGAHAQQPMLSKVIAAESLGAALQEAGRLAKELGRAGFLVCRSKIEIPATEACRFKESTESFTPYFEWHGRVHSERTRELETLCIGHGAHLSRNTLRTDPLRRFVTLREHGAQAIFTARVAALETDLVQHGWAVAKQQSEYCIYDNHQPLDHGWLLPAAY
ncbi:hypothetical protein [Flaviaesturariibacter amylovorans]|uniref:2'-5' RNA ligase family protein n=1 Tax=Flaviaesturariibacter amylovorans TaxID=1084520 RepID=A0ABP8GI29_9BACT